ncbi:hypothetical protein DL89DRAFT_401 [Linderina pennispora]|uniref:Uncharacterized protein n=1 Tax=Linderina pennispora TaxID=61395 RepID=A0A1Y1WJ86_9FUNG|nr:uncharacterized protein DL89DRAFT_401 [Linderina pennispora]ORX73553.1 hypothetical protein DL89DRAFT_401 [Linderina pennispora]
MKSLPPALAPAATTHRWWHTSQSATTSPLPISQPPLPHYSATTLAMANPSLSYPYHYSQPAYSASQQYVHEQQRAESAGMLSAEQPQSAVAAQPATASGIDSFGSYCGKLAC